MKFVMLNEKYHTFYSKIRPINKKGIFIVYDSKSIFIPITSPKKKFESYNIHTNIIHTIKDSDEILGHLKIDEFIFCAGLITSLKIDKSDVEYTQFLKIQRDKKKIYNKIEQSIKNIHRTRLKHDAYHKFLEVQKEQTILAAKNKLNDIIRIAANFENIELPDNYKAEVFGMHNPEDYEHKVLKCMKDAWMYLLDTMYEDVTVEYLIKVNEIVAKEQALKVGILRDDIGGFVHGSDYLPPIPQYDKVMKQIVKVQKTFDKVDAAFEFFCYATKNQLFYDGNKRTALLIINKILLDSGIGFFIINDENIKEFHELLNKHYNKSHNHDAKENLKEFLIEKCINHI